MLEQSRYPVPGLDEGCTSCRTERGMAAAKNRADAACREIAHPLEAAVILSALTFAFALFHTFDGFEWFVGFVQSYEVIELDEILVALLLGGFATLYLAIRRTIDLRCEIRARNEAEDRATRLAHDPLTGLANRHLLVEKISSLIASDTPFALLLIDLDKFKPVNDVHGHEIGDELLIKVSERLRRLDKRLFVARLGGDEFVVLTWDHLLRSEIAGLAADIVCTLQRQFVVSQRIIAIGGTAGIALFPDDATTRQELLRAADLAMYQAKRAGRGTHAFFHPGLGRGARERAELELEVRAALSNGQIKPHFQPVIDLATNAISGFEALARWEHPKRGVIAPSDFIPIVEDLGLQDELLEVILRGAADASLTWRQDMPLAINICASQIQS